MKSRALLFVGLICVLLVLFASSTLAAEKPRDEAKDDNVKEPEQSGGRCRYGCCVRGGPYGCRKCCISAEEAKAAEASVGVNGYGGGGRGGGGGGHCRYGCCGGYGRYCRCCYNQEEAEAVLYGN